MRITDFCRVFLYVFFGRKKVHREVGFRGINCFTRHCFPPYSKLCYGDCSKSEDIVS